VQRSQIRRNCRLGHALSSLCEKPPVNLRAVYGSKRGLKCEQGHGRTI
jgi:hypothetical protein